MRIGLVTGEFPPMEGGVGAFTDQLARALASLGHEIHIITSRKARSMETQRTLASLREPVRLDHAYVHPRINRWYWPSLSAVADIVIRHDIEIVNLQYQAAAFNMRSPAINYLPWRLKAIAPVVVTFHDLRVPYLFPKAGGLRERVVRGLANRAQACIVTNAADYRILRTWTEKDVAQIPIGSNIDAYVPNHIELAEVREDLGLSEGDKLLGYFGFLNQSKGADTLIDALSVLDENTHLVYIGGQTGASDPDNNQNFLTSLRDRIGRADLGSRVHWTGFLSDKRVSTYLAAADLMVMPYRDGVSTRRGTLMAILAHGRPLVTTLPDEPSADFQHGETMWLVPPDIPAALAAGIEQVLANSQLRQTLADGAKRVAEGYGWDAIAMRTAALYSELIEGPDRERSHPISLEP